MQQHGSKYFACSPPLPSEGQNSTFSERGHAEHQRNHECSNMVATADRGTMVENILAGNPLPPPLTLGVKIKFLQNIIISN